MQTNNLNTILGELITEITRNDWESFVVIQAELNNTSNNASGVYVNNNDYYLKKAGVKKVDSSVIKEAVIRLLQRDALEIRRHDYSTDRLEKLELDHVSIAEINWETDWFKAKDQQAEKGARNV